MVRFENFKKPETRAGRLYRCMEKIFFFKKKSFLSKKKSWTNHQDFFFDKKLFFSKEIFLPIHR